MVGYHHDKQIIPHRRHFELINEMTETTVGECYRIQVGVRQPMVGYLKRFVTAQGEECRHPWGRLLCTFLQLLLKPCESDIIIGSPFAESVANGEILVGSDTAISGAEEVALHIGKVDVSPVKHV